MHLVGFSIEIYYDARSYRRQIQAPIPNSTVSNLITFYLCHWLKNKFPKRLKSRVTGALTCS